MAALVVSFGDAVLPHPRGEYDEMNDFVPSAALAAWDREGRADLRKLLQDYRGRSCSLSLNDSHYVSPAATLEGTLMDVDDEWMLMETTDDKGRRKRIVIRFDEVSCIKE